MKVKDYFLSQEEFEVVPSSYKGILETRPKLSDSELAKYYASDNYISHQTESKSLMDAVYQKAKNFMINRKKKLIYSYHKEGVILDIGTGTGDFLKVFPNEKWIKNAIEPNVDLHEKLKKERVGIISSISHLEESTYDIITLWHSLEHIPNLEESILRMKASLKPNGIIIIAVPNHKCYDAKYYKQFWAAWDVPRHVWHFSKFGITTLFESYQLKLIKIRPLWLDAFYISMVSEKYRKSNNMLRAILIGSISNAFGMLKNEFSSFTYVFKHEQK